MTEAKSTLRSTVQDLLSYLRSPRVLAPAGLRGQGNLRQWAWLTAILVAGLIGVLLPVLQAWQWAFSLPDPSAFEEFPKEWLVPTVVVLAPLSEELLFRGWQSGSRAALWLLVCTVAAFFGFALALHSAVQGLILLLGVLIAAIAGWFVLRRKPGPLGWFARFYPAIFYGVAVLFALVHLSNYDQISLLAVPLVLPQFWAGLVLGHIRQRIGLPGAIAAHAVANSCTIGLALAFG